LIRGLWPWPGAFSFLGGKRLKVADATPWPIDDGGPATQYKPGTVLPRTDDELHVKAGDGIVSLRLVQLEGKRMLPIDEFLKGNPVAAGAVLEETAAASSTALSSKVLS
jgi:methionyl-tRNA formyltransferase